MCNIGKVINVHHEVQKPVPMERMLPLKHPTEVEVPEREVVMIPVRKQ